MFVGILWTGRGCQ